MYRNSSPFFVAEVHAVAAAGELVAEAADVFAVAVEDEDRGMAAALLAAFVDDVDVAVAVDGAVVRRLPLELFGQLGPAVVDFVSVVAFAEDDLRIGLRFGRDGRRGENGDASGRGGGGGFDEVAAGDGVEAWRWHGIIHLKYHGVSRVRLLTYHAFAGRATILRSLWKRPRRRLLRAARPIGCGSWPRIWVRTAALPTWSPASKRGMAGRSAESGGLRARWWRRRWLADCPGPLVVVAPHPGEIDAIARDLALFTRTAGRGVSGLGIGAGRARGAR